MSDPNNPFNYPLNPTFGQGIFRRHIRLQQGVGVVHGALEDCNHGFCVTVYHDGNRVTDIQAKAKRTPFTTCPGAVEPLKALIGKPLDLDAKALNMQMPAGSNCTHWLDLAILALQHAKRDEAVREYRVAIPDEDGHSIEASVHCNARLVHEWRVEEWQILEPAAISGNGLYKGFAGWANQAFADDDEREAAFVLQKGYFVSRARRYDIQQLTGESAKVHTMMHGACYSYSEPNVSQAVRSADSVRDFTDSEEEILKFT